MVSPFVLKCKALCCHMKLLFGFICWSSLSIRLQWYFLRSSRSKMHEAFTLECQSTASFDLSLSSLPPPSYSADSASFPQPPAFVREHDVPIFKPEFATMIEGGYLEDFLKVQTSLDMTTQQIIPFIDGFRCCFFSSIICKIDLFSFLWLWL